MWVLGIEKFEYLMQIRGCDAGGFLFRVNIQLSYVYTIKIVIIKVISRNCNNWNLLKRFLHELGMK